MVHFQPHIIFSPNFNQLLSTYRPLDSTSSAWQNLPLFSQWQAHHPDSIDLSSAFDMADHSILLNRLYTSFGISSTASPESAHTPKAVLSASVLDSGGPRISQWGCIISSPFPFLSSLLLPPFPSFHPLYFHSPPVHSTAGQSSTTFIGVPRILQWREFTW